MDNKTNEMKLPEFLKDILETAKKHEDTPSEKIIKLTIERDNIYDKINRKTKELEAIDNEICEEAMFLKAQIDGLKEQNGMLGRRIKQLIDET